MSMRSGVSLLANGSATGNWINWVGGRTALTLMGTLATTTKLQTLGQDGATAIDIATLSTAGVTSYDLPAGQYRLFLNSGSPSGIYANLCAVGYD